MIDNGLDPYHRAFLDENGSSRIDCYWDQNDDRASFGDAPFTLSPEAAEVAIQTGVSGGAFYLGSDFDTLRDDQRAPFRSLNPHGTAVAGIAAGSKTGDHDLHFAGGVAPRAKLIVVRMDEGEGSVGSEVGYVTATDFIAKRSAQLGMPVAINISNRMFGGAHDGTAPVETHLGRFVSEPWRAVVKSAGNDGNAGRHASVTIENEEYEEWLSWDSQALSLEKAKGEVDRLDLWFSSINEFEFVLHPPLRSSPVPIVAGDPIEEWLENRNLLKCHYEKRSSHTRMLSRLSIDIVPGKRSVVEPGMWKLQILPKTFQSEDRLHAWLPEQRYRQMSFKVSDSRCTITVPGTGPQTITVGAVEAREREPRYPDGSCGPDRTEVLVKPDIVAPGVRVFSARSGTERDRLQEFGNGTSLAAPHVTGAIALAFSMLRKAELEAGEEDWRIDQSLIRDLLLLSCPGFDGDGSPERGYGRLDIGSLLELVRDEIAQRQGRRN